MFGNRNKRQGTRRRSPLLLPPFSSLAPVVGRERTKKCCVEGRLPPFLFILSLETKETGAGETRDTVPFFPPFFGGSSLPTLHPLPSKPRKRGNTNHWHNELRQPPPSLSSAGGIVTTGLDVKRTSRSPHEVQPEAGNFLPFFLLPSQCGGGETIGREGGRGP